MYWPENKIKLLIKLFRSRPVLWNTKCKDFTDVNKQSRSLQEVANLLGSTPKEVSKRFKILQNSFFKEYKADRNSQLISSGREGSYGASFCYYNDLMFLAENSLPAIKQEVIDEEESLQNVLLLDPSQSTSTAVPERTSKRRIISNDEIMSKRNRHSEIVDNIVADDNNETKLLAKTWALDFSKLRLEQRIFVKKAINDVLFEGLMENLQRHSVKISETTAWPTTSGSSSESSKNVISLKERRSTSTTVPETTPEQITISKDERMSRQNRQPGMVDYIVAASNNEAELLAKTWALDFSKLRPEQKIFAKKAINDVLFEGLVGNLQRHSVKINDATAFPTTSGLMSVNSPSSLGNEIILP